MEIFAELAVGLFRVILRWIFVDLFLTSLGWLYLKIRYRNKEKQREVLEGKYYGDYSNIPRLFLLNIVYYSIGIPLVIIWLFCVVFFFWWLGSKGIEFLGNPF